MTTTSAHYDIIVVGLGAMGASTLYHLSLTGKKVLGIDQFSPPHPHGSSHGETRITRLAIGEGEHYSPFAIRSHEIWRELESKTRSKLLHQVGGIIIGDASTTTTFHNKPGFLATTIAAANHYGIRHEVLDAPGIRARFPQFNVSNGESAYFEPEAGYVIPELCISSQLILAKEQGASLNIRERVIAIEADISGKAIVQTEHATYSAEQIIVSAGAWVRKLIPSQSSKFRTTRQTLYWFATKEGSNLYDPTRCPVYIWSFGESTDGGIYGFPSIQGREAGIKVATEAYDLDTDPDAVDRAVSKTSIHEMFTRNLQDRLTDITPQCVRTTTCLYTITSDSDFIIGRLPLSPQVIIVSPCSGHGFKHSAAIGEAVSGLAVGTQSTLSLSAFAPT